MKQQFDGLAAPLYSGVELPAAADRALAMLARRPLSGTLCALRRASGSTNDCGKPDVPVMLLFLAQSTLEGHA